MHKHSQCAISCFCMPQALCGFSFELHGSNSRANDSIAGRGKESAVNCTAAANFRYGLIQRLADGFHLLGCILHTKRKTNTAIRKCMGQADAH